MSILLLQNEFKISSVGYCTDIPLFLLYQVEIDCIVILILSKAKCFEGCERKLPE